jgi:hypothetical protein
MSTQKFVLFFFFLHFPYYVDAVLHWKRIYVDLF